MIGEEDARFTFEFKDHYKILSQKSDLSSKFLKDKTVSKVQEGFVYSSEKNTDWFSIKQLKEWINKHRTSL